MASLFVQVFLLFGFLTTFTRAGDARHPTIHIMALWSSQGANGNLSDYQTLMPHWENYVNNKFKHDHSWPFNISLESYDVLTDPALVKSIMERRLNDRTLPNITVIVGEGDTYNPGSMMGLIATQYQIPIILTGLPTDLFVDTFKLPEGRNTTFSMLGPAVRVMRQSVETFIESKAKSVVAVANVRYDGSNR
jgi:hypothetical protein